MICILKKDNVCIMSTHNRWTDGVLQSGSQHSIVPVHVSLGLCFGRLTIGCYLLSMTIHLFYLRKFEPL